MLAARIALLSVEARDSSSRSSIHVITLSALNESNLSHRYERSARTLSQSGEQVDSWKILRGPHESTLTEVRKF